MNKYIYISIPKTGTNSIHQILGNTDFNHITAETIKKILGEKNYNSKISFCFFRNPIDLVKSWYYYHKFSPNVIRQDVKNFYPSTIDEWVFKMKCRTHWEIPLHKRYNPNWDTNQSPLLQYKWIVDDNSSIIVSKVFKFDNIDFEIEKLFNVKPGKKNSSNKDDHTLNPKTEDKIKEIFKKDIKFYNEI